MDARVFGILIDYDDVAMPDPRTKKDLCEIWPEHQQAFQLFMACARHLTLVLGGMGGVMWRAAPVSSVSQVMVWQGIKRSDQGRLWQQYQLMEIEALKILNEREAAAARKSN